MMDRLTPERLGDIRDRNAGKAHGHFESAVSHCAELLREVDALLEDKRRLRRALRNLVDAIYAPDKMGGFLITQAEEAMDAARKESK